MSDGNKFRWVGTRPVRPDGVDKVTGRANYGADRREAGMLYGKILRSPHPHARIVKIDVMPALAVEGVKAAITAADFPELPGGGEGPDFRNLSSNCLARHKVLYSGHAVAAVAATSQKIAEFALTKIVVEYEVLPHVLDVVEAMGPDAPLLHDDLFTKGVDPKPEKPSNIAATRVLERGDVEEGFRLAHRVIEREFTTAPVHQGYIEPHAVVANTSEDGQSTVWCSTQGQFLVRNYCARLLGMDNSQITVLPSEIGGGFGGKTTVYLEPLAIRLSQKAGRPVKLVMSRDEVFRATGPALGTHIRIKVGVDAKGLITAAKAWMAYEAGAFPGSAVNAGLMAILAPYAIDRFYLEGFDVVLNKPASAAYRAPGAPMAAFASESVIDELASELGMDPLDLRMANAVAKGTQSTYGPKYNDIGYAETLAAAKQHPHYSAPLGPNQGRGVASGFWFNVGMQSSAAVNVAEDGTVVVVSGSPDIGGSRASLAMMAAEELDIELSKVRPIVADTATAAYSDHTGGSRVTFATGMAVVEASRDAIRQLRERAAMIWAVDVSRVEWRDGCAHIQESAAERPPPQGLEAAKQGARSALSAIKEKAKQSESLVKLARGVREKTDEARGVDRTETYRGGGKRALDKPITLREIALKAAQTGGPISGRASLTARGAGPGFGTHICDVEVDPETGRTRVIRYTAVQDVGRAIHPSYVEGQLQGGAVQGIGWALNEEYIYSDDGEMQNPGFLDYRMPVASDLPMIDTVLVEVPNPRHPYGVRGVGEVPIVPAVPAVALAVSAAAGVRMRSLPLSPPKLLAAMERV